jgi:hypothetical protein
MCYRKDEESQEEMLNWCNEMDQQQWEEEQQSADYDPQEMK